MIEGIGIDGLLASLAQAGAGRLSLPGVDDLTSAPTYMRQVLELCRERELPFESAWSAGINRLQGEGLDAATIREERALLEEVRPRWQAAYERREPTARERAICTVGAWRRLEGPGGLDTRLAV